MLKRRSKHFALLLVLTMLATMFVGVGTASAASQNVALTVPGVNTGSNIVLGTVRIQESVVGSWAAGGAGVGTEIMLTLPSGVEYATVPTAALLNNYVDLPTPGSTTNTLTGGIGTDVVFVSGTSRTLVVRVAAITTPANDKAIIDFTFNNVGGDSRVNISSGSGDLAVNIFESTGAVTSGDVVNARIVTGSTTVSALSSPSRTEGNGRAMGAIRIIENSAGALATGTASISISLPDGVTWNALPLVTEAGGFVAGNITATAGAPDTDAQGRSRIRLDVNAVSTGIPGVIDLSGWTVDIAPTATKGEINATIGGTNTGIAPATLAIGKIVEFGVTTSVKSTPEIFAGRWDASIGTIVLKETSPASLLAQRSLRLELPSGAAWRTLPVANVVAGNGTIGVGTIVANTNGRTVSYTITGASGTATEIEFRQGTIDVDADQVLGDVKVTLGGTTAVTGEVVVGKIVAPLTATASVSKETIIGYQAQEVDDIVITETAAGALLANPRNARGNIELVAPSGVTFAVDPNVTVTEGNLVIDTANVQRMGGNGRVIIPIQTSSTTAAKIKVSGIKLTFDRTVPEGDVRIAVRGSAVDMVNIPAAGAATVNATSVVAAKVVTPAPGEVKNEAAFVIGSTSFNLNGTAVTMDVAPYIKDSRTYMPIRYVANALGINDANILWDGANQTVTLMRGDKVVQLKVGSKNIVINGASVTMDVAPEITSDRTMLPISFVANAFGATAGWDAATQTVTIK